MSLTVPPDSLDFWGQRLERYGVTVGPIETRFGERVLPLTDTHGLKVALVESESGMRRTFTPWDASPIPVAHQIRGLEGARMLVRDAGPERRVPDQRARASRRCAPRAAGSATACSTATSGRYVDLQEAPGARRGAWGVGSIHHLAWRVDDEAHQERLRERIEAADRRPTPMIDRFWFKSVYFLEPGGVLFELATEGPGFAVDEDEAHLGESLVLPPWLEPQREAIAASLPSLSLPAPMSKPTLAE